MKFTDEQVLLVLEALGTLLERRFELVRRVGIYKKHYNLPILDPLREENIKEQIAAQINDKVSPLALAFYKQVFDSSYEQQRALIADGSIQVSKDEVFDLDKELRPGITACDKAIIPVLVVLFTIGSSQLKEVVKYFEVEKCFSDEVTKLFGILSEIGDDNELGK